MKEVWLKKIGKDRYAVCIGSKNAVLESPPMTKGNALLASEVYWEIFGDKNA